MRKKIIIKIIIMNKNNLKFMKSKKIIILKILINKSIIFYLKKMKICIKKNIKNKFKMKMIMNLNNNN